MAIWHSKSLGHGAAVYRQLRLLDELRYQLCPSATASFRLAIDAVNAQTIAFFAPEYIDLARAFAAQPCAEPHIDGRCLIDLDYQPLAATDACLEIFQPAATSNCPWPSAGAAIASNGSGGGKGAYY